MSDRFPLCDTWATVDEARACTTFPDNVEDEDILRALQSATYILYLLSRRKYPGVCTDLVRPCAEDQRPDRGMSPWGWRTTVGGWCCNRSHSTSLPCSCSEPSKVTLGAYPLRSIIAVEVDGAVLAADEYAIVNRRYLIRMADADGHSQSWPMTQRLDLPLGEVGTWGVEFTYGNAPPQPGVDAAGAYAREWLRACGGDQTCALPARVQSVARQGVQYVIADPATFLSSGLTGVAQADAFLSAERAGDRHRRAVFVNPDEFATVARVGGDPWQS